MQGIGGGSGCAGVLLCGWCWVVGVLLWTVVLVHNVKFSLGCLGVRFGTIAKGGRWRVFAVASLARRIPIPLCPEDGHV